MKSDKYVAVIGAANIDIGGTPYKELIMSDSNPGYISLSYGGVGRNIAHNLAKLGTNVKLITAFGDDFLGDYLINVCEEAGIDMSSSVRLPGRHSSSYMFINDGQGDMHVAIAHVDIVNKITPEIIDNAADVINGAELVVADCNLSHETLMHIKEICKVPICVETVSQAHASKIKGNLDGLYMIKPNRLEAELLTGLSINNDEDFIEAAHNILGQGVEKVFISMGERGVLAADKDNTYIDVADKIEIVNTTGAGDSATAAVVWSLLGSEGKTSMDTLKYAAKAANCTASLTIRSSSTVSEELSEDTLIEMINNKVN